MPSPLGREGVSPTRCTPTRPVERLSSVSSCCYRDFFQFLDIFRIRLVARRRSAIICSLIFCLLAVYQRQRRYSEDQLYNKISSLYLRTFGVCYGGHLEKSYITKCLSNIFLKYSYKEQYHRTRVRLMLMTGHPWF